LGLGRLLQHHDALGARLTRRHGGFKRRAAAADHDDVASLEARHVAPYSSALMPANAMYSLTMRSGTAESFCAISSCSSAPLTARPTGKPRRSASARYSASS